MDYLVQLRKILAPSNLFKNGLMRIQAYTKKELKEKSLKFFAMNILKSVT